MWPIGFLKDFLDAHILVNELVKFEVCEGKERYRPKIFRHGHDAAMVNRRSYGKISNTRTDTAECLPNTKQDLSIEIRHFNATTRHSIDPLNKKSGGAILGFNANTREVTL